MEDKKIPVLRFPEFSEEWESKKLGMIAAKITAKNKFFELNNVLTNSATQGIISQDDYFDRDITTQSNLSGYYIVEINDFVYNPRISSNALVGSLQRNNLVNGIMSPLYTVFRFKSGNLSFFEQYFKTKFWHDYMKSVANSGARHDRLNITDKKFFNLPVSYPFIEKEQQKIADFLTQIDNKINQLSQKKQLLERYKKGVMQQIFSQEIRFTDDEGREFPEWEERKLAEVLTPEFREVEKPKGAYLAIGIRSHCKGTFQKPEADPEKNAMDNLFQVKENDLIVNITFAWEGAIAIVRKEDNNGFVSHRFPTYVFKEEMTNAKFFQYVFIRPRFREQLDSISPGGAGRNRVMSKKDFLKIKCEIPTVPEQTKIANFLTALDEKIALVEKQHHGTKQYKKGLLQQLFV